MRTPLLLEGMPGASTPEERLALAAIRGTDSASLHTVRESGDGFRDECGVAAVFGHPEAARQVYLSLYALQHRGQESGGIATADGTSLFNIKGMGLISEIFTEDVLRKLNGEMAIGHTLSQVDGAFSIVMMTRDRIFAARDPRGFRPLSMGRIVNPDGPDTIVFASETCAFDLLHAKYERDVAPGELVMVSKDGVTSRQFASGVPRTSCIFEHVYFARPDSRIFGRWVQDSREAMGRKLARESHVDADLVVPVPDSGVTAALGYAEECGLPFRFGLIRNHYVGRTFIEPEQRVRDFGVRLKLNPVRNLLEGKRVVLIDDSIIRGTTSRKIVRMVRAAGAKEVHLRISCPPTISPCFYGVDTPSKKDLIGANKSVEEIRRYIEADSLAYLSLDGLQKAVGGEKEEGFCVACYTGVYPTSWVDVEDILPAPAVGV
jgi:amidophosphoribosyltransferase